MIPLACSMNRKVVGVGAEDPDEVMGINTIEELKKVEKILNNR